MHSVQSGCSKRDGLLESSSASLKTRSLVLGEGGADEVARDWSWGWGEGDESALRSCWARAAPRVLSDNTTKLSVGPGFCWLLLEEWLDADSLLDDTHEGVAAREALLALNGD